MRQFEVPWAAVDDEAVRHLQNLVRIDTTNPPGNESEAARYLAAVFEAEGLRVRRPGRWECPACRSGRRGTTPR